jgi:hypothetical protein
MLMHRGLMLKGKFTSSRQNVWDLIKRIETGVLKLDKGEGRSCKDLELEEREKAFHVAAAESSARQHLLSSFLEAT